MSSTAQNAEDGTHNPATAAAPSSPWYVPSSALAKLITGVVLIVAVFVLGVVVKLSAVASWSLRVDRSIALHHRTSTLTSVAKAFTKMATPGHIGIGAIVFIPCVLAVLGRRVEAVKTLCILCSTFVLALVAKAVIAEHRPPATLWAIPADSGASFPSGHTAVASAIAVALVVVAPSRLWRAIALVLGVVYAVGVGLSRVYVANHYPLDVVGGVLCALAAGFVVVGLSEIPAIGQPLARLNPATRRQPDAR